MTNNSTIRAAAVRIIDAAGQGGGFTEVELLAAHGWPSDCELDMGDIAPEHEGELRAAIQDEAKRVVKRVAEREAEESA